MEKYLPYIVSVICAAISGFASYSVARKQGKADLKKLEKQHELDIEKEREKFTMEKERIEIEHKHQLEMQQKEFENAIGSDLISTFMKEYLHTPEGQAQLRNTNSKKRK